MPTALFAPPAVLVVGAGKRLERIGESIYTKSNEISRGECEGDVSIGSGDDNIGVQEDFILDAEDVDDVYSPWVEGCMDAQQLRGCEKSYFRKPKKISTAKFLGTINRATKLDAEVGGDDLELKRMILYTIQTCILAIHNGDMALCEDTLSFISGKSYELDLEAQAMRWMVTTVVLHKKRMSRAALTAARRAHEILQDHICPPDWLSYQIASNYAALLYSALGEYNESLFVEAHRAALRFRNRTSETDILRDVAAYCVAVSENNRAVGMLQNSGSVTKDMSNNLKGKELNGARQLKDGRGKTHLTKRQMNQLDTEMSVKLLNDSLDLVVSTLYGGNADSLSHFSIEENTTMDPKKLLQLVQTNMDIALLYYGKGHDSENSFRTEIFYNPRTRSRQVRVVEKSSSLSRRPVSTYTPVYSSVYGTMRGSSKPKRQDRTRGNVHTKKSDENILSLASFDISHPSLVETNVKTLLTNAVIARTYWNAVEKVQNFWRLSLARLGLRRRIQNKMRNAVLKIQLFVKLYLERRSMYIDSCASVSIVTFLRGTNQRQEIEAERNAIVVANRAALMSFDRSRFLLVFPAALYIQHIQMQLHDSRRHNAFAIAVKTFLSSARERLAQKTTMQVVKAMVTISTTLKQIKKDQKRTEIANAAKQMSIWFNSMLLRHNFLKLVAGTKAVQSFFKGTCGKRLVKRRKDCAHVFVALKRFGDTKALLRQRTVASSKIADCYKRFLAVEHTGKISKAAGYIQDRCCAKQKATEVQSLWNSAVTIQAWFRTIKEKRNHVMLPCIKIQSVAKQYLARSRLKTLQHATRVLIRTAHTTLNRTRFRERIKAKTSIVNCARAYLSAKRGHKRRKTAIMKIKAMLAFKMFVTSRRRQQHAAHIVQSFAGFIFGKRSMPTATGATTIARITSGFVGRLLVETKRLHRVVLTNFILRQNRQQIDIWNTCSVIKSAFARHLALNLIKTQKTAAVTLQSAVKMWSVSDLVKRSEKAKSLFVSQKRSSAACKHIEKVKESAAQLKGWAIGNVESRDRKDRDEASQFVSKVVSGYLSAERTKMEYCAGVLVKAYIQRHIDFQYISVFLQASNRLVGSLNMVLQQQYYNQIKKSVNEITTFHNYAEDRMKVKLIVNATKVISSEAKTSLANIKLNKQSCAARKVAKAMRLNSERQSGEAERNNNKQAFESFYTRLRYRAVEQPMLFKLKAAIELTISTAENRIKMNEFNRQRKAAETIRLMASLYHKEHFKTMSDSAAIIQGMVKCKHQTVLLSGKRRLDDFVRSLAERSVALSDRRNKRHIADIIRGQLGLHNTGCFREAGETVVAQCQTHIAKKLLAGMEEGSEILRKNIGTSQHTQEQHRSSLTITAFFRGFLLSRNALARLEVERNSALVVESVYRSGWATPQYAKAARTIQASVRRHIVLKRTEELLIGATSCLKLLRGEQERRRVLGVVQAIGVIQTLGKSQIALSQAAQKKASMDKVCEMLLWRLDNQQCKEIHNIFRMKIGRLFVDFRRFRTQQQAAAVVVGVLEANQSRKTKDMVTSAVSIINAFSRCVLSARRMEETRNCANALACLWSGNKDDEHTVLDAASKIASFVAARTEQEKRQEEWEGGVVLSSWARGVGERERKMIDSALALQVKLKTIVIVRERRRKVAAALKISLLAKMCLERRCFKAAQQLQMIISRNFKADEEFERTRAIWFVDKIIKSLYKRGVESSQLAKARELAKLIRKWSVEKTPKHLMETIQGFVRTMECVRRVHRVRSLCWRPEKLKTEKRERVYKASLAIKGFITSVSQKGISIEEYRNAANCIKRMHHKFIAQEGRSHMGIRKSGVLDLSFHDSMQLIRRMLRSKRPSEEDKREMLSTIVGRIWKGVEGRKHAGQVRKGNFETLRMVLASTDSMGVTPIECLAKIVDKLYAKHIGLYSDDAKESQEPKASGNRLPPRITSQPRGDNKIIPSRENTTDKLNRSRALMKLGSVGKLVESASDQEFHLSRVPRSSSVKVRDIKSSHIKLTRRVQSRGLLPMLGRASGRGERLDASSLRLFNAASTFLELSDGGSTGSREGSSEGRMVSDRSEMSLEGFTESLSIDVHQGSLAGVGAFGQASEISPSKTNEDDNIKSSPSKQDATRLEIDAASVRRSFLGTIDSDLLASLQTQISLSGDNSEETSEEL